MDKSEEDLPNVGFVRLKDAETGRTKWLNSGSKKVRKEYRMTRLKKEEQTKNILRRSGVDFATMYTNEPYVKPLIDLFKKR